MSLDDIDEKFKKGAQKFHRQKKKVQSEPSLGGSPLEEKDKYEDSFRKKQTWRLLSVFENHLRNQLNSQNDDNDDEFK